MGTCSTGSRAGSGASNGDTAAPETKGRNGSITQLMQDMKAAQTKGMVVDPDVVRKSGFASTAQLEQYKNDQYFTSGTAQTRKARIEIKDAPFLDRKGNAAIVSGKQDAANFVDYLKTKLDVGVESYTNDSWIVHYKSKADLSRKRQSKR